MPEVAPYTYGNVGGFYSGPTSDPFQAPIGTGQGVSVSDYLTNFYSSGLNMEKYGPAFSRWMGNPDAVDEEEDRYQQQTVRLRQEQLKRGMSPDAQSLLNSTIGSSDFWQRPLAWTALRITGSAPETAAAVVVGALTGPAGGLAALLAAGATEGVLSAGDMLDTIQQSVDDRTDEQLLQDSVPYRQLREGGASEAEARQKLQAEMSGNFRVPLLIGATTVLGAAGVPGQYLRAAGIGRKVAANLIGEAPAGVAKRVGREFAIGAGTEAVQSGAESLIGQTGAVAGGFLPGISVGDVASTMAEGALVGGVMGAPAGIFGGPPRQAVPAGQVQPGAQQQQAVPAGGPLVPGGNQGTLLPAQALTPAQQQAANIAASPQPNLFNALIRYQQGAPQGVQVALPLGLSAEQQAAMQAQSSQLDLFGTPPDQAIRLKEIEAMRTPEQEAWQQRRTGMPPEATQQQLPLTQEPMQQEMLFGQGPPANWQPAPEVAGPPEMQGAPGAPVIGPPEMQGPPPPQQELPFVKGLPPPRELSVVEQIMKQGGISWGTYSRLQSHMAEMPDDELAQEADPRVNVDELGIPSTGEQAVKAEPREPDNPLALLRQIAALQEYALRQEHGTRTANQAMLDEQSGLMETQPAYPFETSEEKERADDFVRRNASEAIAKWLPAGENLALRQILPASISPEEQQNIEGAQAEDLAQRQANIDRVRQMEAEHEPGPITRYPPGVSLRGVQVLEPIKGQKLLPKKSHKGEAYDLARMTEDERTQALFDEFADQPVDPTLAGSLHRFGQILARAKELDIKPRKRIGGYETTAKPTFWLTEIRRIKNLLELGRMTGEKLSELHTFLASEMPARADNDFSGFEESRKLEGELRSGRRGPAVGEVELATPERITGREDLPGSEATRSAEERAAVQGATEETAAAREKQEEDRVEQSGEYVAPEKVKSTKAPGMVELKAPFVKWNPAKRRYEEEEGSQVVPIKRIGTRDKPTEEIKSKKVKTLIEPTKPKKLEVSVAPPEEREAIREALKVQSTRLSRATALAEQIKKLASRLPSDQVNAKNLLVEAGKAVDRVKTWLKVDTMGLEAPDLDALLWTGEKSAANLIGSAQMETGIKDAGFRKVAENLAALRGMLPKTNAGLRAARRGLEKKRSKERIKQAQKELKEREAKRAAKEEVAEEDKAARKARREKEKLAREAEKVAQTKEAKKAEAKLKAKRAKVEAKTEAAEAAAREEKAEAKRIAALPPGERAGEIKARARTKSGLEKLYQQARTAGAKAFRKGIAKNPYRRDTRPWREWEQARITAERDAAAKSNAEELARQAKEAIERDAARGQPRAPEVPFVAETRAQKLGLKMGLALTSIDANPYKSESHRAEWEEGFRHGRRERITTRQMQEAERTSSRQWKPTRGISQEEWEAMTLDERDALENAPTRWDIRQDALADDLTVESIEAFFGGQTPKPLSHYLDNLSFDYAINTLPKHLQKLMANLLPKILHMSRNTPTYVLDDLNFNLTFGRGAYGQFTSGNEHYVVLRESQLVPQTVLHEATHAALMRGLHNSPQLVREGETLLDDIRASIPNWRGIYGLTNIDEMAAEGVSSARFRQALRNTEPKLGLRKRFWRWVAKIFGTPEYSTQLEWLMDWIDRSANAALQVPEASLSDAALRSVSNSRIRTAGVAKIRPGPWDTPAARRALNRRGRRSISAELRASDITDYARNSFNHIMSGAPKLLGWRTNDQLAQLAKDFGSAFGKAVRAWADAIEKTRVTAEKILKRFNPVLTENMAMWRKYQGTPEWEAYNDLVHDEQMLNVDASHPLSAQPWLGATPTVANAQVFNKWLGLNQRWQALPADLKNLRQISYAHYGSIQTETALKLANNRLMHLFGIDDRALAQRIIEGTETPADITRVGSEERVDIIREAASLTTKRGPYAPMMRYGSHVVNGTYRVTPPASGTLVTGTNDTYQFNTEQAAINWAQNQDLHVFGHSVWVDRTTGQTHVTDASGNQVKVSKNDTNAVEKYRVRVGIQHTDMATSRKKAEAIAAELNASGLFEGPVSVQERRYQPSGLSVDLLSSRLDNLITRMEKDEAYRRMTPEQKAELKRTLQQGAISMLGSTRIQSHRLPRRYVQGASKDFVQAAWDYSRSAAGYLAKLEHQPAIDAALSEAGRAINDPADATRAGDLARSSVHNEMVQRSMLQAAEQGPPGVFDSTAKRAASLAFSYFLGSPAYWITNGMQTTISMAVAAGRFGMGKVLRHYGQAYKDVTAVRILGLGVRAMAKRAMMSESDEDFVEQIINGAANLTPMERAMLHMLRELGVLGGDVGLEVGRAIRQRGGDTLGEEALARVDKTLDYLGEIARAMPRAVEAINRTVTALASYRMEMEKNGGDHDAAVQYAQEHTNLTQGIYSETDAPRMFKKNVLLTNAFVFKKYPQLIYGLLSQLFGKMIRDANPGDRAEAMRAMGWFMGATVVMAGALGLPLEPFKILLTGLNSASGGTTMSWDEVENYAREVASSYLGKTGGEIATRGLPRLFGIDLSHRVGLQDLALYGTPRTEDKNDFWAWVGQMVGGAPGSMAGSMIGGAQAMLSGDIQTAAETLIPFKALQDTAKAYRETTIGKRSEANYESYAPTSLLGGVARAAGFTPASVAEAQERRNYFYQAERALKGSRDDWMHKWQEAGASGRSKLWTQIVEWNREQAPGVRLKRVDLNSYAKRRARENTQAGIRLTRVNEALFQQTQGTYNVGY